jgi:Bacteriophage baseplate protein W
MSARAFLGRGWGFPVLPDPQTRGLEPVEGPEKVRQSLVILLETEPGERLMRPAFGCGLRRYLMKPNTAATRALIRQDVERALSAFEPRIRLQGVRVEPGGDPAEVRIEIAYVHTRDSSPGNLVYPFYLE